MTDLESLYAAIVADPTDDTVRLIYADALDDRSQSGDRELAEFIRIHLITWHMGREDPERNKLGNRSDVLFDLINGDLGIDRPDWLNRQDAGLAGLATKGTIEIGVNRGFAGTIRLTLGQWAARGKRLVNRYPLTKVLITNKEPAQQFPPHPPYRPVDRKASFVWAKCWPGSKALPHELPKWLWKGWRNRMFSDPLMTSRDDAYDYLSDMCLHWAHDGKAEWILHKYGIPNKSPEAVEKP